MLRMKKYNVQCPVCCGSFHETTNRFQKDRPARGDMFTLRREQKEAAWSAFPEYDTTEYADICCPSCGAGYLDSEGQVIRLQDTGFEITPHKDIIDWDKWLDEYDVELPETVEVKPPPIPEGKAECPVCKGLFSEKGIGNHIKFKHPEYEG